jgi:hypothetical protein
MIYTGIDRIKPARRKKKLHLPHRRALPGADQSMTGSPLAQQKTAEIFRGID